MKCENWAVIQSRDLPYSERVCAHVTLISVCCYSTRKWRCTKCNHRSSSCGVGGWGPRKEEERRHEAYSGCSVSDYSFLRFLLPEWGKRINYSWWSSGRRAALESRDLSHNTFGTRGESFNSLRGPSSSARAIRQARTHSEDTSLPMIGAEEIQIRTEIYCLLGYLDA